MLTLKTSRDMKLFCASMEAFRLLNFLKHYIKPFNSACCDKTPSIHPGSRCLVLRRDTVCNARGIISIWRSRGSKELPQDDQRNHLIHLLFPSDGHHSLLQLFCLVNLKAWNSESDAKCARCAWQRILGVQYSIPDYVRVSSDCRRLLSQIFVSDPSKVLPFCVRESQVTLRLFQEADTWDWLTDKVNLSETRLSCWRGSRSRR